MSVRTRPSWTEWVLLALAAVGALGPLLLVWIVLAGPGPGLSGGALLMTLMVPGLLTLLLYGVHEGWRWLRRRRGATRGRAGRARAVARTTRALVVAYLAELGFLVLGPLVVP